MANATILVETQVTITNTRGVAEKPIVSSKTFSTQKEVLRQEIDVAAGGTVVATLFDPGVWTLFPIGAFKALVLLSDQDLMVEFIAGKALATPSYFALPLVAELPMLLGADDSFRAITADAFAGTAAVINSVRVKNLSATLAAKLTCILVDDT